MCGSGISELSPFMQTNLSHRWDNRSSMCQVNFSWLCMNHYVATWEKIASERKVVLEKLTEQILALPILSIYYVPRISLVKKFFFFRNWTLFWILIIMLSFQVSTHSLCRNNALCLINELCTEKSLLESQDRTNVILCLTYGTAAARFQQAKI